MMECVSEPNRKPPEFKRFKGIMTIGQIWGEVRAIQHTDNFIELSEFGCQVDEGVRVWNYESYEGWIYKEVEKGDWVVKDSEFGVFSNDSFHKNFVPA